MNAAEARELTALTRVWTYVDPIVKKSMKDCGNHQSQESETIANMARAQMSLALAIHIRQVTHDTPEWQGGSKH